MRLKLVKASNEYCNQIKDMLDEWNAFGEKNYTVCNLLFRL